MFGSVPQTRVGFLKGVPKAHAETHIDHMMRAKQFCQRGPIEQLRGGGVFEEVEDVVLEACAHQTRRGMGALQARDV
eukprot:14357700-Heterocapsa_arctica.AAC.1